VAAIARIGSVAVKSAALILGLLCLAASLAAEGGRVSQRLDLLTEVAPFWMAGALGAAALGAVGGSRRWRLTLIGVGAAGIIAALPLVLPEYTRPIRAFVAGGGVRRIKLIQFNAHEYATKITFAADWLTAQKPDFITMEDVGPALTTALVARGFIYTGGIGGSGIFSRQPAGPQSVQGGMPLWPRLPSFARATFASPTTPFTIVAAHLPHPTVPGQLPRASALAELLDRYDRKRLIVAGDFNLAPWSFGLRYLDQRLGLERRDRALFSWPSYRSPIPLVPIDHVYAGADWRTVSISRGPNLGSHHYPVVAILVLED
jgi:endonuclease/exonuclease/phosphatase (EEP) superfamily protein YafD